LPWLAILFVLVLVLVLDFRSMHRLGYPPAVPFPNSASALSRSSY
jgi:hypothetical protein